MADCLQKYGSETFVRKFGPTNITNPDKLKEAEKLTPVILLHAMLCTKEIWEGADIPERIANSTGRTVYYDDAPCHGAKYEKGEFSFDAICEDLDRMMNYTEIDKAILVGHSMGGKAAILAALKRSNRVEQVFIVDMHVGKIPQHLITNSIIFMNKWREAVQELPKTFKYDDITEHSVNRLYKSLSPEMQMETEKRSYLKSTFVYKKRNGKYDVSYNAEAIERGLMRYRDEEEQLSGEFNGPSYFLYGSESPYKVGDEQKDIKKYFPKAEMIEFKGAPHHLFVHDTDKFMRILVEKLGSFV